MSDDEGFGNEYVEDFGEDDLDYITEDEFEDEEECDEDKPVEEVEINEDEKEEEEEDEENVIELDKIEEEEDHKINYEKEETSNRVSFPFLTKYEKARLIGVRATQLSQGAKTNLKISETIWDPIKLAELEIKEKCIPLIVRRYLPNGKYEDWSINELLIF